MDELPPREVRYAMADEYVDLVCRLFDSWEADAVVMDRERGVYADSTKVHPIHFKGEFFKCAARSILCRRCRGGQFSSKPVDRHAAGHLRQNMLIRSSPPQMASPG